MPPPQLPDDVLRVSEARLQEKLSSDLDRVAHADEELVVMREGEPIVASQNPTVPETRA
jgi:hypothetical protein